MTGTEPEEKTTVSTDGVTVTKQLELTEFEKPSIVHTIASHRQTPALVQFAEPVPESTDVEAIQFHPQHGKEHWSVFPEKLVFTYRLAAGEGYRTVYSIPTEEEDIDPFRCKPTALTIEPLSSADAPDTAGSTAASGTTEKQNATDKTETAGLQQEATSETPSGSGSRLSTNQHRQPRDSSEGNRDERQTQAETTGNETNPTAVVDALIMELREGNLSPEKRQTLQEVLGEALNDGSLDARVAQLQRDMADLRAYTAALEEFLEDEGTGKQLLAECDQRLAELEDKYRTLQSTAATNQHEVQELQDRVEAVETDVDRVESQLASIDEAVNDVDTRVVELDDQLPDDVAERIATLESEIEDLRDVWARIQDAFTEPSK